MKIMLALAALLSLLALVLLPRRFISSWLILEMGMMRLRKLRPEEPVRPLSEILQILEREKSNLKPKSKNWFSSGAAAFPVRYELLLFLLLPGLNSSLGTQQVLQERLVASPDWRNQIIKFEQKFNRSWVFFCVMFYLVIGGVAWKLSHDLEIVLILTLLNAFLLKLISVVIVRPWLVNQSLNQLV